MKTLKYILFLLLIVIIGFSIYVAVQPNEFNFSRSKVIQAPASVVFNKVNDFKNWPSFSPWMEQEPNATLTYGEKTSGVDGTYAWSGKVLGEGSMKTLDVKENELIAQHINFIKPFESESDINWMFESTDEGTRVTWQMKGKQDFMTKMFTTFAGSIEEMTGPDFERGLFKLDSIITTDMQKYSVTVDGITEHGGGFYLYNTTSCKIDELEPTMKFMFSVLFKSNFVKNNIAISGPPFIYYHKWDEKNNAAMFSCCVPTTDRVIITESKILTGQLEPFKALKTTLKGNYTNLKEAWETAMKHVTDNGLEFADDGPMLEVYVNDPMTSPNPANWITEIYIAIK